MASELPSHLRPDWSLGTRLQFAFSNPEDVIEGGVWSFFFLVEGISLGATIIEAVTLDRDAIESARKIKELRKEFILTGVMFSGTCSSMAGWLHRVRVINLGSFEAPISTFGYSARIFTSGWRVAMAIDEFNDAANQSESAKNSEDYHKARQQQTLSLLKLVANTLAVAWSVLGLIAIAIGSVALVPIIDGLFMLAMVFWISEWWMKMQVKSEEKRLAGSETTTIPATAQLVSTVKTTLS